MVINVQTTGTLQFSFGAGGSQTGCYDWIMWPYTGPATCTAISNNTQAPVACSWNSPCMGGTGMAAPASIPAGGYTSNFVAPLNVTCGQKFIVCFSNYSSLSTTVPLNFFGTAQVSCNPIPNPITVANQTICQGNSATLTATGAAGNVYTWQPGNITGPSITVTPTVTTTYTVSGTGGCGSQTGTQTATVTVNGQPATITGVTNSTAGGAGDPSPTVQCVQNNSFSFTSVNTTGVVTHTWNFGPNSTPATSNVQNPTNISYSVPGTYTVTHTVTQGACVTTSTVVVTVTAPPTVTTSPVNATCTTLGSATANVSGGSPAYTYNWTPSGGTGVTANNLNPGNYTVTVTDAQGCTNTATAAIINTGTVVANNTASPNQCVNGNNFTFTNTGTGGATYSWNFGNGNTGSGSPVTQSYASAGTYTVTQTVTLGTCVATFTRTVVVYPRPNQPTLTPTNPNCGQANGQISASATGGTPAYNFTWAPSGSGNPATGLVAGTYTCTVIDQNGCSNSNTVVLTNVPGPSSVVLTPANASCGNNNGTVTVGAVTGGTPGYTYGINGGPLSGSTLFSGLPAGTHTVTIQDSKGCPYQQTVIVGSNPGPSAVVLTPTSAACGTPTGIVTIGAVTGGSAPYTYSFNGSGFTGTTSYTGLLPGVYTVIVKDNFGCQFTSNVTVGTTAGPTALALSATNTTCGNNNGTITTGAVTGGTAPYTYAINGGSFSTNTSFTNLPVGTHTITVKDNNGCTFNQTINIINVGGPTNVVLTPVNATCGASNGSITIGAVTGGQAPYTYSFNGGGFSGTTNYTNLASGTYTITVRDNNNCQYTTTVSVSNTGGPTALSVSTTATSCSANTGSIIIGAVTGGTSPYTYSVNGTPFSATTTYNGVGQGVYPVTVMDNNGCQFSTTATVGITAGPTAVSISTGNTTCGLSNGTLTIGAVTGGTPGYTYSLNGSPFSGTLNYNGLSASTHTVIVRDANGCTFTQTATITNTAGPTAVALSAVNSTCGNANGTINIGSVTGGTPTYSYSVNGGPLSTAVTYPNMTAGNYTITVTDANNCTFNSTVTVLNTAGPTGIALTPISSTCGNSNGVINVGAVTGGTPTYSYSINGGSFGASTSFGSLAAGTYTVAVQDNNGCQFSQTAVVANIPGPTAATATVTSTSCGGNTGTINVTSVTGGTSPYQYSINGGPFGASANFTSLGAATYTITVRDNNLCTYTLTATVPSAVSPVLTISSQVNVSCNGGNNGSVVVSATGGTATYTYSINSGGTNVTGSFTNLSQGNYTISVVDAANCTGTLPVTITQPTVLTASISVQSNVTCNGGNNGSVTVVGSGGTLPYNFSLNGGPNQPTGLFNGLSAGSFTVTVTDNNGCNINQPVTILQPTQVSLTFTTTSANCTAANGNAIVTATGGTPGYTYSWSGGGGTGATSTPLASGTYTVTVHDANNCMVTGTATIGNIPGGNASVVNQTNVSCSGGSNGSITVSISGSAASSFTYNWTPNVGNTATVSNLSPGNYSVTITDNFGCVATASTTITQPPVLNLSLAATNVSCNGGSNGTITATTTGGTPTYSYVWNPSVGTGAAVSGLQAGTYSCTVTDANGCSNTKTITLVQPTALSITSNVTQSACNQSNGAISVTGAGGTSPYTFSLNGGPFVTPGNFTALPQGTYTITIKDAFNCTANFPVSITDQAGPTVTLSSSLNATYHNRCDGAATVNVTGGASPYTYAWNNGGTTPTIVNLCAGIYSCIVTDANGCNASVGVTITQPTPLTATVTIQNPVCNNSGNGSATVQAQGGTPPYSYSWSTVPPQTLATATNLIAGSYNVMVTDANGCQQTGGGTLVNPPAIVVSLSKTDLDCFNSFTGTASAVVNNGTAPYNYNWVGTGQFAATATGLAAGTYTCNVTDVNGCTGTANITVNQPTQLQASIISSTNVSCSGSCDGTVLASASGATPPYSYNWNGGLTGQNLSNLCVGNYTCTVTDSKGCIATTTVSIVAPNPLVMNVTKTNVSCFGFCDGTASANFSGGTAPYNFLWQPGLQTGFNPNNLCAGTHTVTLTDAMGCSVTHTISITQPPQLSATTTAINSNCGQANGTAIVTASGGTAPITYMWSNGATSAVNINIQGGVYNVVVTDANNCSVNAVANVNDIAAPTISISSSNDITCFGANNGSASCVFNGGATPYQGVTWMPSGQSGAFAGGLAPGIHTVMIVDAAGCVASASTTINEPPQLVAVTTNIQHVTCNGLSNGSATVLINGGTPMPGNTYNINWTPGSVNTPTYTGMAPGTYQVTITDANNCQVSATATINQPPPLVLNNVPGSTNISCFGANNGVIGTQIAGGTAPYTFVWTPNVGAGPTVSALTPGNYSLTVTDSKGCMVSNNWTITQPTPIALDSLVNPATCSLNNGQAQVLATGGTPFAGGVYTYNWNTSPTQNAATALGLSANTYTCTVTDANNCTASISVIVNNLPGPAVVSTGFVPVSCNGFANGSGLVNYIQGTAPMSFTWVNQAGSIVGTHLGMPNTGVDSLGGLMAGSYNVTIMDVNGCFASALVNISQPPPLNLFVSPQNDTICYGQQSTLFATPSGGTSPYTYLWTLNGTGIQNNPGNPGMQTTNILNNGTTNSLYTYVVNVTDSKGCPPVNKTITVLAHPAIKTTNTPVEGCDQTSGTISATASLGNGGPYTINWTSGGTGSSTIIPLIYNNPDSVYYIGYTVSDGCSLPVNDSVKVTVHPKPNLVFVALDNDGCMPFVADFNHSSSISGTTFMYLFGDGNTTTTGGMTAQNTYTTSGVYAVTLVGTTQFGCKDTTVQLNYITVYPNPVANFTYYPTGQITELAPDVEFYNASSGANSYHWNMGDPLTLGDTSSNPVSVLYSYPGAGTYTISLVATTIHGCKDSIAKVIKIDPEIVIYIPNAFTPYSSTGLNDEFKPLGIGITDDEYQMFIFDRWGELLFESNQIEKGWNGTKRGSGPIVQEDVYVYKILYKDIKGDRHQLVGHVTVVK